MIGGVVPIGVGVIGLGGLLPKAGNEGTA